MVHKVLNKRTTFKFRLNIDIVESLPDGCINHPEKKYWRL